MPTIPILLTIPRDRYPVTLSIDHPFNRTWLCQLQVMGVCIYTSVSNLESVFSVFLTPVDRHTLGSYSCCCLDAEHPSNTHNVSKGCVYLDNCTCCHIQKDKANQSCYDTEPTSASTDPTMPGTWQSRQ